jgi:hypothetical protein
MVLAVQKPLTQRLEGSQQSPALVQRSCGIEHIAFGGVFEQTSAPPAPLGWQ